MGKIFAVMGAIFATLGFIGITLYPPTSIFDEPLSFLRKEPARKNTTQSSSQGRPTEQQSSRLQTQTSDVQSTPLQSSQNPPLIRTTEEQPAQPWRLQIQTSGVQSTRLRRTTVSQPWQWLISSLESRDSDFYRSKEVSDLKSQLPSYLSPSDLTSILETFDSETYRSRALSDLKSQMPSHLSPSDLTSILKLFDSETYRSRVRSDLKSRLTF